MAVKTIQVLTVGLNTDGEGASVATEYKKCPTFYFLLLPTVLDVADLMLCGQARAASAD
jgi:hypothetical protein